MGAVDSVFYPGYDEVPVELPLGHFLPPWSEGMAAEWLKEHVPAGSWVLDPFGGSPQLIMEMARAGYRVLVTANNPITGFILEMMSEAPRPTEFKAVLAELAAARKGDERIELHIQSLYQMTCPNCEEKAPAKAFLWQKKEAAPDVFIMDCPNCGKSGEYPVPAEEQEAIASLARSGGLHRARAVDRVTLPGESSRSRIDQSLDCYVPRSLYALSTLINRMEALAFTPRKRNLMSALILSACDRGTSFWANPPSDVPIRQLTLPAAFREENLWFCLEEAINQWTVNEQPVSIAHWPDLPPSSGGIALFSGRFKDLCAGLSRFNLEAIVTVLPRPNQAYWTLSTIWSGWLWGREAAAQMITVLERSRYDWPWYAGALESLLRNLRGISKEETPFRAIMTEYEPHFLQSMLIAVNQSGFQPEGVSLRPESGVVQLNLKPAEFADAKRETLEDAIRAAVYAHLDASAEPVPFARMHAAALAAPAESGLLSCQPGQAIQNRYSEIQGHIQTIFTETRGITKIGGGSGFEAAFWARNQGWPVETSQADRVEMELVRTLQKHSGLAFHEIDSAMCHIFPGCMTPPEDLVKACLASYGEQIPGKGLWQLKEAETPVRRRADLKNMKELLQTLGEKLAYQISGESPMVWLDGDEVAAVFYLTASALINRFVCSNKYSPQLSFIALPGSRADLLFFKLGRDAIVNQQVARGWRFIKFRHLRHLADLDQINRANWMDQLRDDPLAYTATQMTMF